MKSAWKKKVGAPEQSWFGAFLGIFIGLSVLFGYWLVSQPPQKPTRPAPPIICTAPAPVPEMPLWLDSSGFPSALLN